MLVICFICGTLSSWTLTNRNSATPRACRHCRPDSHAERPCRWVKYLDPSRRRGHTEEASGRSERHINAHSRANITGVGGAAVAAYLRELLVKRSGIVSAVSVVGTLPAGAVGNGVDRDFGIYSIAFDWRRPGEFAIWALKDVTDELRVRCDRLRIC